MIRFVISMLFGFFVHVRYILLLFTEYRFYDGQNSLFGCSS